METPESSIVLFLTQAPSELLKPIPVLPIFCIVFDCIKESPDKREVSQPLSPLSMSNRRIPLLEFFTVFPVIYVGVTIFAFPKAISDRKGREPREKMEGGTNFR